MKNLNRIHLNGLRAIEAVGRLGTLRRAADEMGVTPGAVSQQIQKTEQLLGRVLFERLPKGLTPTDIGEEVVRLLSSGMLEISAAVKIAEQRRDDTLTVSAAPVFTGKWLVWRLQKFNEEHPDIRIRVDARQAYVDPNISDVDVCIRVGTGPWPEVYAVKLVDQRVFPVCSPTLSAQIKLPEDLATIPIIRDQGEMFNWDIWLQPNGLDESILSDGPTFSDASLCLDAAIAGQGAFLAWETIATDALEAGRLVAPIPGRYATGQAFWFVTAQQPRNPKSVRAFESWLRSEISASPA